MPPKLYTKKIRLALSIEGKNHERIILAAKPSNTSVTAWINIAIAEKLTRSSRAACMEVFRVDTSKGTK